MKKNLFFLLLLAIVAVSCQKDIEPGSVASSKTNEIAPTIETSIFDQIKIKPLAEDDVFRKIDAFKAKLDKIEAGTMPETDNGTTVDDAIWNIEALVNSLYAQASKPFAKVSAAKNTIRVVLNDDGTIDNAALLTAVLQTRQKLNNQFQALTEVDKHVIAIDIRRKVPQVESGGSVLVEVEGVYGMKKPNLSSFGSNDYWHWGNKLGTCRPFSSPTDQPLDASVKIGEKLNYRSTVISDVFFTDEEFTSIWAGNNRNNSDVTTLPLPLPADNPEGFDNIRDYIVFKQDQSFDNFNLLECLSPSDMNFYLNGARYKINALKPAGKEFIDIDFYWDSTNDPSPPIFHNGYIHYGVPHYINTSIDNRRPCC
jgi:hypothetical protein